MNLTEHDAHADDRLNLDDDLAPHRPSEGIAARGSSGRWLKVAGGLVMVLVLVGVAGFLYGRHWMQTALKADLPQVDGQVQVKGLVAPVTVARDAQGVPHISATTMDDLVFAQGYVTAGDRLWQMDALRRHGAGELAEVLGKNLVEHDRMQRTLQLRVTADRALAVHCRQINCIFWSCMRVA